MTKQQKRDWAGIAVLITAVVGALGFAFTTIDRYVFDKPAQADEQATQLSADEGAFEYLNHKIRRLERRVIELEQHTPERHGIRELALEESGPLPIPEKSYKDIFGEAQMRRTLQVEAKAAVAAPPAGGP